MMPLQITFHGVDRSDTLSQMLTEQAGKLRRCCDHIIHCRVRVEAPHRHQRHGYPFRVAVDLTVPGQALVEDALHEDPYQAAHMAFDAARRRLVSSAHRRRPALHPRPRSLRRG
jgi:ribosome-associated translation inhibitor RaiA